MSFYLPEKIPFLQLLEEHGSPLYVYDLEHIKERIAALRNAFDIERFHIHYAMKANSYPGILKLMKENGVEIDAVSPGELELAMAQGFQRKQVYYTPSGADFDDILHASDAGHPVTIDNLSQLKKWGETHSGTKVFLRFNPGIVAGGSMKISVGHNKSKFGIALNHFKELTGILKEYNLKLMGIHTHIGSDIYQMQARKDCLDSIRWLALQFPEHLKVINYGGGFKVNYHPDEVNDNIGEVGALISEFHNNLCEEIGKSLKAAIEPGKFLVSESGTFLARVNVLKNSYGKNFAILNTGFNHFVRPMYYDAYHHILNLSNPDAEEQEYDVCGYLCEEDTFAHDRILPEIREGDILAFLNAGAYSYSMASEYNKHTLPVEVLFPGN